MALVRAICISEKKGVAKHPVKDAKLIENYGIETDAHAGKWHRQVSLLSYESIEQFNAIGAQVSDGDFGENLIVEGINLKNLPIGSIFVCNGVQLKLTQIGKQCHSDCEIKKRVGDCIMPREGVFAEVICGGVIHVGDQIEVMKK